MATVTITHSINIEFTEEEVRYLEMLTQNYLGADTEEPLNQQELRGSIFKSLHSINYSWG